MISKRARTTIFHFLLSNEFDIHDEGKNMNRAHKLAIVLTAALALAGCGSKGTGEKNGVITRVAQTGIFCKTWEAEIIRGGLNQGSGVMGQAFSFTIEDKKLLPVLQNAFEKGLEVRIHYNTEMATFCRSDSEDHFLTAIEIVGPGQGGMVNDSAKPAPTKATVSTGTTSGTTMSSAQIDRMLDQHQQMIDLLKAKNAS
jgi:hypothetical protein